MFQWAWSYLTYERGARVITGSERKITQPTMEYLEDGRWKPKSPPQTVGHANGDVGR